MIVLLLVLFVIGVLVGLFGQRMLSHWDVDNGNNMPHNTSHHHRT